MKGFPHDHDHHPAPVDGVVHQDCAGVSLHHLDPLQGHCQTNSPQASVQLLGLGKQIIAEHVALFLLKVFPNIRLFVY